MLAACAVAPAIVRASSLMPIVVPRHAMTGTSDYLPTQDFSIGDSDFTLEFWRKPVTGDLVHARSVPRIGTSCFDTNQHCLLMFDGTHWLTVRS